MRRKGRKCEGDELEGPEGQIGLFLGQFQLVQTNAFMHHLTENTRHLTWWPKSMYGYLAAWLHVYMALLAIWLYGYLAILVYGNMGIWVYGYMGNSPGGHRGVGKSPPQ